MTHEQDRTTHAKGLGTRAIQLLVAVLLFATMYLVSRAAPAHDGVMSTVAVTGFLLLAGTLLSELSEPLGLPHLMGYLAAGVLAGPYVLGLVDHEGVERLSTVNTLALALIALAGGAELKLADLRAGLRSLSSHTIIQHAFVLVAMTLVFVVVRPLVPFTHGMAFSAMFGVALLWGAMSVTRSPAATLGILAQTRASGPLARHTLRFVMTSNVLAVVLIAVVMMIARPLILPGVTFSLDEFRRLGHDLVGSVALGTTLGLVLALYLRLIGTQLVLVFLALGFGMTEVMHYLGFDPLLGFMVAGFVVQNLSGQGTRFLKAIEQMTGVVYVLFFATAGAHLDLPILRQLWPVALLLIAMRGLSTWTANALSARPAHDVASVRRWGWSGLVAQAGLALGLAEVVARAFPSIGREFRALALATIALNELIGPVLFKFGLDRCGETSGSVALRPSLGPPAPFASGAD